MFFLIMYSVSSPKKIVIKNEVKLLKKHIIKTNPVKEIKEVVFYSTVFSFVFFILYLLTKNIPNFQYININMFFMSMMFFCIVAGLISLISLISDKLDPVQKEDLIVYEYIVVYNQQTLKFRKLSEDQYNKYREGESLESASLSRYFMNCLILDDIS